MQIRRRGRATVDWRLPTHYNRRMCGLACTQIPSYSSLVLVVSYSSSCTRDTHLMLRSVRKRGIDDVAAVSSAASGSKMLPLRIEYEGRGREDEDDEGFGGALSTTQVTP